ncbi:hypothetical protein BJX76DRAFT_360117 [Aspergillus varians]
MAAFRPFSVYINPGADTVADNRINFEFTFRVTMSNSGVQTTCVTPTTINEIEDTDPDQKYRQARNLGPCPAVGEQGHGLYEGPDRSIRPAYGRIFEILEYPITVWVKPQTLFDGRMYYPIKKADLIELQRSRDENVRVGDFGYGLWLRDDGNVVFGLGRVLQVFRGVKLAFLNIPPDEEERIGIRFAGRADPNPPILRFRSTNTIAAYR